MHMANTKPYVAVACLAESVLTEPDGVASIIRIADTFTVDLSAIQAGAKAGIVLSVFISLKSGDVKGVFQVELLLRTPSGKTHSFGPKPIELKGGIHGANMKVKLDLRGIEMEKEYWLDVLWEKGGELLTSIPFRFMPVERSSETLVAPEPSTAGKPTVS